MRVRGRGAWRAIAVGALAFSLWSTGAAAQTAGDRVRIQSDAGVIEGTLVDRLPEGYLVRLADGNHVIPYAGVKSIEKLDGAPTPPSPAPSAPPVPAPSAPQLSAPQPAAPQPAAPPLPPQASPSEPSIVVLPPVEGPYYPPPQQPPPVYYTTPPPRFSESSVSLVRGGKSLLAFGILGLVTGAILAPVGHAIRANNTCHDPSESLHFQCEYGHGQAVETTGDVFLVAGTLVTLGGIGMIVGGVASRSSAWNKAPSVAVGPRGAAVTWTF